MADLAADREAVLLAGQPINSKLGDREAWRSSAAAYLAKAIRGASGAATVRVSVVAVELVLPPAGGVDA